MKIRQQTINGTGGEIKTIMAIPGWAQDMIDGKGEHRDAAAAYLASAWVQRAIEIKSDGVLAAPLAIEQPDGDLIWEHPALDLLENVNAEFNGSDLWRYTEAGLNVWGGGFWEKARNGRGEVTELFCLNPSSVEVQKSSGGIGGFKQKLNGVTTAEWERKDVVYFRGRYNPKDDLVGLSPLIVAVSSALADQASNDYLSAFFKNSAIPAVIFSTDNPMPEPEVNRFLAWINKLFRGKDNAHKAGILGNGLKPYQLSSTVKDLALADVRAAVHQNISTALGVPELLISPAGANDLTPVEAAEQYFVRYTMMPRWQWYAGVLNSELLPEFPDLVAKGCKFVFDTSEIPALQENIDAKVERLLKLEQAGIITKQVVAMELGYEDDDMPGEAEAPEPADTAAPPAQAAEPDDAEDPEGDAMTSQKTLAALDYERWCAKACKSVDGGRSAAVKFTSDYIPMGEHARISRALLDCRTADDVRGVFAGARTGSDADRIIAAVVAATRKG